MGNWSTSNYRQRKAQRQAKVEPAWQTNPETGEKFLIRRLGGVAYALAGALPQSLTKEAVEGWAKEGVEVESSDEGKTHVSARDIAEGQRNLQLMARVVVDALVEPKVVAQAKEDNEIELSDLDDSDAWFIFRCATGVAGMVPLQGGQAANVADIKSLRKKPGRRSRTGTGG